MILFLVMRLNMCFDCRFPYALPCICISAFALAGLFLSFHIPVSNARSNMYCENFMKYVNKKRHSFSNVLNSTACYLQTCVSNSLFQSMQRACHCNDAKYVYYPHMFKCLMKYILCMNSTVVVLH